MVNSRDNEYQDPVSPGSLVSTLRIWQALQAGGHEEIPQYVSFALQCTGEARANRLASSLRRRLSCKTTMVRHVDGGSRDLWQVEGVTYREMQSLEGLQQVSSWLRAAAVSHQVRLIQISLVGTTS